MISGRRRRSISGSGPNGAKAFNAMWQPGTYTSPGRPGKIRAPQAGHGLQHTPHSKCIYCHLVAKIQRARAAGAGFAKRRIECAQHRIPGQRHGPLLLLADQPDGNRAHRQRHNQHVGQLELHAQRILADQVFQLRGTVELGGGDRGCGPSPRLAARPRGARRAFQAGPAARRSTIPCARNRAPGGDWRFAR